MSCERASQVDLAAFEVDPNAPGMAAFRDHYPTCVECSLEVGRWARLIALLEDDTPDDLIEGAAGHPDPEMLLAFGENVDGLDPDLRLLLESHLQACGVCRCELSVLESIDMAGLTAPLTEERESIARARQLVAESQDPSESGSKRGGLSALSHAIQSATGLRIPEPALAALVIVALALPVAWLVLGQGDAEAVEADEGVRPESSVPAEPQEIAEEKPSAEPAPVEDPPAPVPAREPLPAAILLASLIPEAAPHYLPDATLIQGPLTKIRTSSLIRSVAQELPKITALAPPHIGVTGSPTPNLYWHLSAQSPAPVEVVLARKGASERLLEVRITAPVRGGLRRIDLERRGIRLEPGHTYEWSVTLVPDYDDRDLDVISNAAIQLAPVSDSLDRKLRDGKPTERAHVQAAAGYWYDAFQTLTRWIAREPSLDRLREQRAALLRQVDLDPIE